MPSQRKQTTFKPRNIPCPVIGCDKFFSAYSGRTRHINAAHPSLPTVFHQPPPDSPRASSRGSSPDAPAFSPFDGAWSQSPDPCNDTSDVDSGSSGTNPSSRPHITRRADGGRIETHPLINGTPCDAEGRDLPPGTPPPSDELPEQDDFYPFKNRAHFELTDFFYRQNEISSGEFNYLMQLWAATLPPGSAPPFANYDDYLNAIDSVRQGEVPWQSFKVGYTGERPDGDIPPWMDAEYDVWFRCPREIARQQISNPDFAGEMDWAPKRVFNKKGKREWCDFMSGNWAWKQADTIAQDEDTHHAAFCPLILGSDKTTVSVATGQNEYYPLYQSIGNAHNNIRRAHRNAVTLVAFLAIPKTEQDYSNDPLFRKFRRQLFHTSLVFIYQSVRPGMTVPEIMKCADGHYRRVIWGLGPYIADYPEQALLACIVQGWCPRCTAASNNLDDDGDGIPRSHEHTRLLLDAFDLKELWDQYGIVGDLVPFTVGFPRADIHELLSPDLLHQVIKGTFKDHLVTWVNQYIMEMYGKTRGAAILADIDRRIAAVPGFPGLRRFPQGRGFKQWTGDDSKALMKVYLPAIAGHVPPQVVRTLSAFLDFCYLVRRNVIDEDTLQQIKTSLQRFHEGREIFRTSGVRPEGFSLPRQHSLKHYAFLIQEFGAPNGLCSSITESAHIRAVKKPWRRSNRNRPLGQMLLTNQRLDKLAAARVDFASRGMLVGPCSIPMTESNGTESNRPQALPDEDGIEPGHDSGPVNGTMVDAEVLLAKRRVFGLPRSLHELGPLLGYPQLEELARRFLHAQLNPAAVDSIDIPLASCPVIQSKVSVFPSAVATFFAPSDHSGIGGMRRERIRSVPSWRGVSARRDCVFLQKDADLPGFRGLHAARVHLFFSFTHDDHSYPCALINWYVPVDDEPDYDTGMWIVAPEVDNLGQHPMEVVHLDCMIRAAHLIGVAGEGFIPRKQS